MPFLPFVSIITFYWQCVPCPWFLITCPAVMMPKAAGRRLRPRTETSSGEVAAIHAWVNFLWLWWIETDSDGLKLIQMDWIGFRWNETESHGLKENQIDWNGFTWFLMGSKEIRCLAFNGLDWLSRWTGGNAIWPQWELRTPLQGVGEERMKKQTEEREGV